MSEYAIYEGQRVEIGTCGDLLYLRAGQAHWVEAEHGSVDPIRDADRGIRYRFPFPDEDNVEPGSHADPDRTLPVYALDEHPVPLKHGDVKFTSDDRRGGYTMTVPCPESVDAADRLGIARSGIGSPVRIAQQEPIEGVLALVCECSGCGRRYRLETKQHAWPVIEAVRGIAADYAPDNPTASEFWRKVAGRIISGYLQPPTWVVERTAQTDPCPCKHWVTGHCIDCGRPVVHA